MNSLSDVTRTAFSRATPENIRTVFEARLALLSILMLPFLLTALIVFLIGPLRP